MPLLYLKLIKGVIMEPMEQIQQNSKSLDSSKVSKKDTEFNTTHNELASDLIKLMKDTPKLKTSIDEISPKIKSKTSYLKKLGIEKRVSTQTLHERFKKILNYLILKRMKCYNC